MRATLLPLPVLVTTSVIVVYFVHTCVGLLFLPYPPLDCLVCFLFVVCFVFVFEYIYIFCYSLFPLRILLTCISSCCLCCGCSLWPRNMYLSTAGVTTHTHTLLYYCTTVLPVRGTLKQSILCSERACDYKWSWRHSWLSCCVVSSDERQHVHLSSVVDGYNNKNTTYYCCIYNKIQRPYSHGIERLQRQFLWRFACVGGGWSAPSPANHNKTKGSAHTDTNRSIFLKFLNLDRRNGNFESQASRLFFQRTWSVQEYVLNRKSWKPRNRGFRFFVINILELGIIYEYSWHFSWPYEPTRTT